MTRKEWEALVEYTLNIGRQMLECGAEAWRAENTMARHPAGLRPGGAGCPRHCHPGGGDGENPRGGSLHQHLP